ncbi:hypothetical protein [Caldinitratiruptor microaerophilus]|uniref:Uncharacterized protein n=1 Tax=Caldinitratiruptor microaerophilus TaxID=671077 RepID=A0AA35GBC4_9FIRM|nr:hypothetical protein [Caldinitratiruptor microaerophilus]BDG62194.1 hypothetical protein caldi_32840 [Caldinitratiruptor microaerophilus]
MRKPMARFVATSVFSLVAFAAPFAVASWAKVSRALEERHFTLSFPSANPKPVTVDLRQQGYLKRILQPGSIRMAVSVVNKGQEAPRIRLALEGCPLRQSWSVNHTGWREATRTVADPIPPGFKFSLNLFVSLPRAERDKPVICDGRLAVYDADTGRELGFVPVRIVNSSFAPAGTHEMEGAGQGAHGGHHH